MGEISLILLGIGYLIYRFASEILKDIKTTEGKIDMLNLHLKEIEMKLNQIEEKSDKK